MKSVRFQRLASVLAVSAALFAAACGSDIKSDPTYPETENLENRYYGKSSEGLFGSNGLLIYGKKDEQGGSGIGVNSFLWRASLDTLSFMPLASADPFGGVIITDWYSPPETPDSRFKANVFILDRQLRADGIKVTLFQQRRDRTGAWVDAEVNRKTATDLEDTILTRARQLRIASAAVK